MVFIVNTTKYGNHNFLFQKILRKFFFKKIIIFYWCHEYEIPIIVLRFKFVIEISKNSSIIGHS